MGPTNQKPRDIFRKNMEYIPDVESGVPLPASATEAMPDLSSKEELEMRARTIKLVSDLTGKPIEPTEDERMDAMAIAQTMMTDPSKSPQLATYSNPTLAYLAGMVAQYDTLVVRELAELKTYVVNRLVAETEHADAKIRLGALKALGEIDGVDAFKRRSEMTVKQQSIEEVEKELLETLEKLEKRTVDAQARVVSVQDVQDKYEDNAPTDSDA